MPDATGTPTTNFNIPKYNTGSDPPSGKGFNTAMDFLDALLANNATLLGARARVAVRKNSGGSDIVRRRINFIEGANITLTVGDDAGNEEVDVTITGATASGIPVALTGIVNSNGTIAAGTGFSVNRTGAGQYTVTFTSALAAVPVILANVILTHAQTNQHINIHTVTTGGFFVQTTLDTGATASFTDYPWNFIALVPQ